MVKIRLRRMGGKKKPYYRVVATDSRSPRDGRFIETLGRYDPRMEPSLIELDEEKVLKWLREGAQPSDQVVSSWRSKVSGRSSRRKKVENEQVPGNDADMKELLEYLAKALVDNPESVEVTAVEGERSVILQLRVDPDDVGKVIGKKGRIAQAMRTLIKASANREGRNAIVEIID